MSEQLHFRDLSDNLREASEKFPFPVTSIAGGGGSSSATSVGGGLNSYFAKPSGTNADGTSTYASATTITVTGLPFTFTARDIVSVTQVPNAGGVGVQSTVFNDPADFTVSGSTITVAGASFAATDEFEVAFNLPVKAYDVSNNTMRIENTTPDFGQAGDAVTVLNAVTDDTTVDIAVKGYKSVHFIAVSSDTALLHASIDLLTSDDDGTTFRQLPGQAVSLTRNQEYSWWANVASATNIQVNFDELVATAGTVTLVAIKSYEEAPNPQFTPSTNNLREALVLTGSYVTTNEVFIEGFDDIAINMEFTTGATGASDTWNPSFQIEVSDTRTGDNWKFINAQAVSSGTVTNTRATYKVNGGSDYTAASTTFKDVIEVLNDNPGWKRIRVGVFESTTPTNQGTMTIKLTAK